MGHTHTHKIVGKSARVIYELSLSLVVRSICLTTKYASKGAGSRPQLSGHFSILIRNYAYFFIDTC